MLKTAIFGTLFFAFTWLLISLDAFEEIHEYSRAHEEWELDEIIIGGLVGLFTGALWLTIETFQAIQKIKQKTEEANDATQQALVAEDLFAKAYRSSPALFTISTPGDGQYLKVNQAWFEVTGHSINEALNKTELELNIWDKPEDRSKFIQHILDQGSIRNYETVFRSKYGEKIDMLLSGELVQYQDRDCLLMVGMDITENKEVERMKKQFISTVSHELRTPLTSIQGSLGLLTAGKFGEFPDDATELLEIGKRNSARLLDLVNTLLDLDKLESSDLQLNVETISLSDLVEEAVDSNKPYADQSNVTIEIKTLTPNVYVIGDKDRLGQVMSNLLSNAVKVSPSGEKIQVSLERYDDIIRTSITDNGPGVPVDFRSIIFDPFTQADASDERHISGIGLGLNISQKIIQQHGGSLDFLTQTDNGSTFYFTLPALH
ncbi:MAG: PAS domain-containing sensor histidine kinase [Magnetovibrio sp.]|nr:PAS domain-containing sensor histidine kinase [Magnetovibrio sp.]